MYQLFYENPGIRVLIHSHCGMRVEALRCAWQRQVCGWARVHVGGGYGLILCPQKLGWWCWLPAILNRINHHILMFIAHIAPIYGKIGDGIMIDGLGDVHIPHEFRWFHDCSTLQCSLPLASQVQVAQVAQLPGEGRHRKKRRWKTRRTGDIIRGH